MAVVTTKTKSQMKFTLDNSTVESKKEKVGSSAAMEACILAS